MLIPYHCDVLMNSFKIKGTTKKEHWNKDLGRERLCGLNERIKIEKWGEVGEPRKVAVHNDAMMSPRQEESGPYHPAAP